MSGERYGWMVCNVNGDPCGEVWDTAEEAVCDARGRPPGCGYHVRPVTVRIEVRGRAPEPWLHGAPTPTDTEGGA